MLGVAGEGEIEKVAITPFIKGKAVVVERLSPNYLAGLEIFVSQIKRGEIEFFIT